MLGKMRVMVSFYRNKTYRKWLRRALRKEGVDVTPLLHFSASFIKWRYQTVPLVESELVRLRFISQNHLRREFFTHAKDKKFIASVFEAAEDMEFWVLFGIIVWLGL